MTTKEKMEALAEALVAVLEDVEDTDTFLFDLAHATPATLGGDPEQTILERMPQYYDDDEEVD